MYTEELKIPQERIAIVLGKKGYTKRKIEKLSKTKLKVQSIEGDVFIQGEDSFHVYITKNIIKAIGRGFNPDIALSLLSEENQLEILSMIDYIGKSKNKLSRVKARIIGTKGKCRATIEQLTNTSIEIYGKTISIIGKVEDVVLARQAIERILQGSKHGNVYSWLEKQKKLLLSNN